MPFLSDTTWPAGLLTIFDISRQKHGTFENRYYGPYTKLLNYCFGESFTYHVALQNPPTEKSRDSANFIIYLVVFNTKLEPVLIAEVKDDTWARRPELRLLADEQLRQRYDSTLADCPIPRLWGLSLLGTTMRVYCGNTKTGTIDPPFTQRPDQSRVLPSSFLENQWNIDILSQGGFQKMKEIVKDIVNNNV